MNFKKLMGKKTIGTYIDFGVLLLAIVTLIVYLTYATSIDGLMMPWVIVLLLFIVAGEVALFFFDNDYIPVAVAALSMTSFGCFAVAPPETLGSIVDYFQNIVMFGHPEKFSLIVVILVFMLLMSIAAIVACFFDREKSPEKANGTL